MDQNPSESPRRRWLRFSLRTMFVLMLLASIPLAWVGYSLNWVRQRQAIIGTARIPGSMDLGFLRLPTDWPDAVPAPNGLWLFGEYGVEYLRPGVGKAQYEVG